MGQIREGWCRIRDIIQEAGSLGSSTIPIASLLSETIMKRIQEAGSLKSSAILIASLHSETIRNRIQELGD